MSNNNASQTPFEGFIKKWLRVRNMQIRTFAVRIDVGRSTVYNWFDGKGDPPGEVVHRIFKVLHLPRNEWKNLCLLAGYVTETQPPKLGFNVDYDKPYELAACLREWATIYKDAHQRLSEIRPFARHISRVKQWTQELLERLDTDWHEIHQQRLKAFARRLDESERIDDDFYQKATRILRADEVSRCLYQLDLNTAEADHRSLMESLEQLIDLLEESMLHSKRCVEELVNAIERQCSTCQQISQH